MREKTVALLAVGALLCSAVPAIAAKGGGHAASSTAACSVQDNVVVRREAAERRGGDAARQRRLRRLCGAARARQRATSTRWCTSNAARMPTNRCSTASSITRLDLRTPRRFLWMVARRRTGRLRRVPVRVRREDTGHRTCVTRGVPRRRLERLTPGGAESSALRARTQFVRRVLLRHERSATEE